MTARFVRHGLVAGATILATFAVFGLRERVSSQEAPPPKNEIPVRTMVVGPRTGSAAGTGSGSHAAIAGTGTLEARRRVELAFAVGGVVDDVRVEDGDRATRGAALVALDATPFLAARDEAAARIQFLEARVERSRTLLEQNAVSQEEFDSDGAELAALRARLRQAEWNVSRATLRAPFTGLVEAREVELGQVVAPGTPAITLIDVDTLEVQVPLAARDVASIAAGTPVTVTVADGDPRPVMGFVHHEPVVSDPRAGTVSVTVWVPNLDRGFLPGLLARCELPPRDDADGNGALTVPLSAVRMTLDGPVVFRLVTGDGATGDGGATVERVSVTAGPARHDAIEVVDGLAAGDVIVESIPDRLQHGDRVRAVASREGA